MFFNWFPDTKIAIFAPKSNIRKHSFKDTRHPQKINFNKFNNF